MKHVLLPFLLGLATLTVQGQVVTIFRGGKPFESGEKKQSSFEFSPSNAALSKAAIQYLDQFGAFARETLHPETIYHIKLTAETPAPNVYDGGSLEYQRLTAILQHLQTSHGLKESQFKIKITGIIATSICEEFSGQANKKQEEKH